MSGGGASTTTGGGGGGTPMLMPMCTSAPRAGAASNPAASAITIDVGLILRPPCVYYRQPAPASPALPSGAPNPEAGRQRLVEQPRLLARLERHRLAHEARRALAVRHRLQPSRDPLAKGFVEIAFAVARRARELRERERVGLGSRPRGAEKPLRPRRRRVAPDHAVERAVERRARAEPRQRPQLRLGRAPALGLGDEHPAQLGTRRGGETLAAPHRLPHLAQLLRARPRPPGLAAAEERGAPSAASSRRVSVTGSSPPAKAAARRRPASSTRAGSMTRPAASAVRAASPTASRRRNSRRQRWSVARERHQTSSVPISVSRT